MKSGNSESLAGERNVYRYHCEGKINFLAFMPILVTLSSVGLLASSCAGSSLSTSSALAILQRGEKPRPLYRDISQYTVLNKYPGLVDYILDLKAKYTSEVSTFFMDPIYSPTDEGKSYFKKIQCQSSQPRACGGNFAVGHLSISGVSGVLNDSASNTAIAKFTVKIEPTRFYDSVCSNERCPAIGQATAEGTAKFKRYDEGWRIESVEYPLIY